MPPTRITAHAEKLREALRSTPNEWLTRRDIAFKVGKKRLTPYDIELLDLLAERKEIYRAQEEGFSREGFRWVYGWFDKPPPEV